MPRSAAEQRADSITQLDFTSLTLLSANEERAIPAEKAAGLATFGKPDVYRSAPHIRRKARKHATISGIYNQSTFDDLFAAISQEAEIPSPISLIHKRSAREKKQNRQYSQLGFDSLTEIATSEGSEAPTGKLTRSGTEYILADVQQSDQLPAGRAEEALPESLEQSNTRAHVARRRRVILDEPEPEQKPIRDFRISREHGVGTGSLHEKATANIAAIRLLKTLEGEHRDATEEEKAVLVRYAGWGALKDVFEYDWRIKPEWKEAALALKELLTEEEYESARATTPNAHFTSPLVITAIWDSLQKLGLGKKSEVLEPSCGIAHFFGMMPDTLQGGHRTGVELDSITARIAKHLYPDTTIFAKGFEETQLPDNYFDVVVGNVPFGDYPVHDPTMKHSLTRSIHDYFFAKSLEKVRPGGIMALITSRFTMDKQDSTIRKHLAEKADLIAAIRLPNTAFKGNAGTEVTTDILFLQKRSEGQEPAGEHWTETKIVPIEDRAVALNEYYINHPDMMLGEMKLTGSMYRDKEPTLAGELTELSLRRAIHALPEDVYIPRDHVSEPVRAMPIADSEQFSGIKDGAYALIEGKIMKRCGNTFEPTLLSSLDAMRVRGLMQIRDAVREVFRTQLEEHGEERITKARQHLNSVYDQFVFRHGYISSRENSHAFSGDPDHPLLLSLENYDAEKMTATKSVIFERRTLERYKPVDHVETASEALAISLNETGGIKWERMAQLTGYSIKELRAELDGQVYQTPQGEWETADEYLSGNVRDKLKTAEAAAMINPSYHRNVEALKAVQPPDILPGDINAKLGASWIPKSDIAEFIADLLQVPVSGVSIYHAGDIATWSVKLDFNAAHSVSNTTTYGTNRIAASDLIEESLNMSVPTIYVLKPVYTRAGGELTDPQEGCKLKDIKIKTSGEQPCLGVRQ